MKLPKAVILIFGRHIVFARQTVRSITLGIVLQIVY